MFLGQTQTPGLLDGLADNRNALIMAGLGLASGNGWGEGARNAMQGFVAGRKSDQELLAQKEFASLFPAVIGQAPQQPQQAPQPPVQQPNFANAIASIESGGKYDILGPVTKTGDRAYGKYQVMGANIGPWSKEALGQEVTPQQFLANPEIQDKVFQHRFGQYVQKHGPEGAARAWFAGEGGMNDMGRKDQLGTSVAQYAQKFNSALGPQQQPYRVASADPSHVPIGTTQPAMQLPQAQQSMPVSPPQAPVPPPQQAAPMQQGAMSPKIVNLFRLMSLPGLPEGQRKAVEMMLSNELEKAKSTDDIREFEYARRENPSLTFEKFMSSKKSVSGEYGMQPIYGTNEKGETVVVQLGKAGDAKLSNLPPGIKLTSGIEKIDLGPEWGIINKRDGTLIGKQPKDIVGKESAEEVGKDQGLARAALPAAEISAKRSTDKINAFINHPGFSEVFGTIDQFRPNWTMSDKGRDALARFKQLSGEAFLEGRVMLKGGGAITDFESAKAEAAVARLERSLGEEDAKAALREFKEAVSAGLEKLRARARNGSSPIAPAPAPDPLGIR